MKTKRNRNWIWGIILLLAAGGLVATQFGLFAPLDFWTLVTAVFAVIFLVSSITQRTISTLPLAVAMVYIVLRNQEIMPYVTTWAVIVAAVLVCVALGLLFPQRPPPGKVVIGAFCGDDEDDDWDESDWDEEDKDRRRERAWARMGGIDNNPYVSVNFGHTSRYLHADKLQTAVLSCNFGGMDIYFDQVELDPNGATVNLDCKFGGIDIFVPRHWRVDEQISCTIGGVDINTRRAMPTADGPQLVITGHVLCGGVDIWYV